MTVFMLKFRQNTSVYGVRSLLHRRCKVVYSFALLILLSCTTTKNVQKSKSDEKTEIKAIESITTTSVADGSLQVKGDSLATIEPIDSLLKEVVVEDGGIEIKEKFDPVTRKVKVTAIEKAHVIPVHTTVTAVTNRTVTEKKEVKEQDFSKRVERSWWNWWYLLIVAALLVWIFRKEIFSRLL